MVEVEMRGVDELVAKLKNISYDARYKGGRFALRKAAQLVRDKAKSAAIRLNDPDTGRSIAQNIVERWNGRVYRRTGDLAFRVGVLNGAVLPKPGESVDTGAGGPTPHWRLLEFGTEQMAARPFMRPALADNIQQVTDVFVREYSKAIDRAIKKGKV